MMKVLLDLKPALDGFSGIPQETRLLFHGLASIPGVEVSGLLQSGNLVLDPGLPMRDGVFSSAQAIDRLSRVVVSLQQGPVSSRFEHLRKRLLRWFGPAGAALGGLVGARVALTRFDATHFRDFVWRALFAKSLPPADIDELISREFRVLRWPWSIAHGIGVVTSWLGHALYPRLDTRGVDLMLAETPYPGRVARGTRLVVRYHDAFPLLMPHTVKDRSWHRTMHYQALKRNAIDGAWFACVSESTRRDLLAVMPGLEARAVTIPNMICHHFVPEQTSATRVGEILWARRNLNVPHEGSAPPGADAAPPRYLLIVSTIEPRKNHAALLDAWELLRHESDRDLRLVCVGSLGWDHDAVIRRIAPWLLRGGVHLLEGVPAQDLRLLYRHAQATVCPSLGEGFDFAGIEAMASGGVVAASDIAVHREVYGAASEYFSPYDVRAMADAIGALIDPAASARRDALVAEGFRVVRQYRPDAVLPQWQHFLSRVVARN